METVKSEIIKIYDETEEDIGTAIFTEGGCFSLLSKYGNFSFDFGQETIEQLKDFILAIRTVDFATAIYHSICDYGIEPDGCIVKNCDNAAREILPRLRVCILESEAKADKESLGQALTLLLAWKTFRDAGAFHVPALTDETSNFLKKYADFIPKNAEGK